MSFLLYLSAQTPAKREIKIWGIKVQRTRTVIKVPEEYLNVMYHNIAKLTTDEPKVDIVWLNKNRNTLFFQLLFSLIINIPPCYYKNLFNYNIRNTINKRHFDKFMLQLYKGK